MCLCFTNNVLQILQAVGRYRQTLAYNSLTYFFLLYDGVKVIHIY